MDGIVVVSSEVRVIPVEAILILYRKPVGEVTAGGNWKLMLCG